MGKGGRRGRGRRTQSYAFDSCAQTSGHSSGVIVASDARPASVRRTSCAIVYRSPLKKRRESVSVVDEHASQSSVRDLYDPDLIFLMRSDAYVVTEPSWLSSIFFSTMPVSGVDRLGHGSVTAGYVHTPCLRRITLRIADAVEREQDC